jgi:hypothetical protein
MRGNAYGSTLRLSLGCLLTDTLGIELRRVGSGTRLTFADGEAKFSEWLEANARASWVVHPRPWEVEPGVIEELSLPLNLDHNRDQPFYPELKTARAEAKARARSLPAV